MSHSPTMAANPLIPTVCAWDMQSHSVPRSHI
nr:MAG TPA: hypothetical protein [Caudoviricetes sp.]